MSSTIDDSGDVINAFSDSYYVSKNENENDYSFCAAIHDNNSNSNSNSNNDSCPNLENIVQNIDSSITSHDCVICICTGELLKKIHFICCAFGIDDFGDIRLPFNNKIDRPRFLCG